MQMEIKNSYVQFCFFYNFLKGFLCVFDVNNMGGKIIFSDLM